MDEAEDSDGAVLEIVVAVDARRAEQAYASIELPDGVGWSSRSFLRATSSSPSAGERKKPPR
jgi:hypothetical protein